MTMDEFRERYDGLPIDEVEMANAALEVTDNEDLFNAADEFVRARSGFLGELELADVEFG